MDEGTGGGLHTTFSLGGGQMNKHLIRNRFYKVMMDHKIYHKTNCSIKTMNDPKDIIFTTAYAHHAHSACLCSRSAESANCP